MEDKIVIIKRKKYLVLGDGFSCAPFKKVRTLLRRKKKYSLVIFNDYKNDKKEDLFEKELDNYKSLANSAVRYLKIYVVDKNNCRYVREYIEGETIFDALREEPLKEDVYKDLFMNEMFARASNLRLNYFPTNFVIKDKQVVYMSYECSRYDSKHTFELNELRYYVYSSEFISYLKKHGYPIDNSRIKPNNEINKETVLLVLKYRR